MVDKLVWKLESNPPFNNHTADTSTPSGAAEATAVSVRDSPSDNQPRSSEGDSVISGGYMG